MRMRIFCLSRTTAKRRAPWAAVIARVTGGYLAFDDVGDYDRWRMQR